MKQQSNVAVTPEQALQTALEVALECLEREGQLLPAPVSPQQQREELGIALAHHGRSFEDVVAGLRRVLAATPSSASPRFFNQLFGGRDPVATMADMLAPLFNCSMYTFKAAGPQVLIEQEVLRRMADKVGYRQGEGMLSPGGSLSNLYAMLLARDRAVADGRERGLAGQERLRVYTSELSHYSIRKNAGVLGIGRSNVREVVADWQGKLDVGQLRRMVAEDLRSGYLPMMINATAGTTVLGAFDPIREIAAMARENGIWVHVDGAFGGTVALCEEHRHLLDGAEMSDSFTWNAHKMMGIPLLCSAVLVARPGLLDRSLNESADYLFQAHSDEFNPGTRSIQCGRRNDALKLWAAWQYHGDEGYDRRIRRQFWLARRAAELIAADPDLELLIEPESLNVCFEVSGKSSAEICERLDRQGRLKIGHGIAFGRRAIRVVCVNPDLDQTDLETALAEIKQVAAELPAADNTVADNTV